MKSKIVWIVILLVVGAGVVFFIMNVGGDSADAGPAVEEPLERQSVPVRVTRASEQTLQQRVSYSGTIEAWERADVVGQSGQRIEGILVGEGDRVRRGQVVVHMDDSNLRQAEADLRTAHNEVERMERLVELGAVARQQLEQAENHYETISNNVEVLRSNTHLTSPIDGVVTNRYFVAGEHFMAGAQAPAIVTVQQIDPLRVVIDVSERYFPVIRPDMQATVRLDTYGDRQFEGRVARVNPTISPDSRTFRVEIVLENSEGLLSPGMFARASLELGEVTGQFLPRDAVQRSPGSRESFVYVVEDGQVSRVYVTIGERAEEYERIESGLDEDALVVIEGMGRLSEGTAVRVINDDEPGDEG